VTCAHPSDGQPRVRVLIVDDDPSFRSAALGLLAARGYQVVGEAGCGADGLALASEIRPDSVLLDVNLPDADGVAVAARLTVAGGARVLLTSSDSTAVSERLMRSCGAVGFVAKEDLADAALDAYLTG
jgi:DNA-binding NarL/FixJ family response regulator